MPIYLILNLHYLFYFGPLGKIEFREEILSWFHGLNPFLFRSLFSNPYKNDACISRQQNETILKIFQQTILKLKIDLKKIVTPDCNISWFNGDPETSVTLMAPSSSETYLKKLMQKFKSVP